jgi:hypothetical protein
MKPPPILTERMRTLGTLTVPPGLIAGAAVAMPAELKVSGGLVSWSEKGTVQKIETEDLLESFLGLTHDTDVLNFAMLFGPLRLCEKHKIVSYHRPLPIMDGMLNPAISTADEMLQFDLLSLFCIPTIETKSPRRYSEPVEEWLRLAKHARGLLAIANHLRDLESAAATKVDAAIAISGWYETVALSWGELDGLDLDAPAYMRGYWPSDPWTRLAEDLNRWLRLSDVELFVVNQQRQGFSFRLQLGSNRFTWSVLSLVALQLVSAVIGAERWTNCSVCGLPYAATKHAVSEDRRNYCPECRRKNIPRREATRAWRERERKKQPKGARK